MDRAHCYEPWSSGGSIPLRHITHPLSDDSPKQRDLSGHANFLRQHRPYGRFIFYLPHPNPPFQTLYLPHTAILSYQWTNKKHRQIHCFISCLRQPNHYHNKSTTKKTSQQATASTLPLRPGFQHNKFSATEWRVTMKHKKIFATIVAIACTLVLATGCSVTPHEDVMKSDSATIEQSDKADSKDVQKDNRFNHFIWPSRCTTVSIEQAAHQIGKFSCKQKWSAFPHKGKALHFLFQTFPVRLPYQPAAPFPAPL